MDRKKTLGLALRSKRRRDSDPSEEERSRNKQKTEGESSRTRSNSVGGRQQSSSSCGQQSSNSDPSGESSKKRSSSVSGRQQSSSSRGHQSSDEDLVFTGTDSGIGRSRGFLFPGHNYLGPGNPEDNGPPTNRVDAAAQKHDREYGDAIREFSETGNQEQAFQSVQQADNTFLTELSETEPASYTEFFGKLAGRVGIGGKRLLESALHSTLYPRFKRDEDMDVTDSTGENSNVYHISHNNPSTSLINFGPGIKNAHETSWAFNKHFQFALESHLFQYKQNDATKESKGLTHIKPCIHSLPWEKLYFYLSEKEYNTITSTFHTAYVESVTVKIYNLGVANEFVQGTSSPTIKNISPNHYLGIWRGYEKHGPVSLGNKITSSFLYGTNLQSLGKKSSFTTVDTSKIGAVTEMKTVDNRITYNKITSRFDETANKSVNIGEANIHLPPVYEMASLTMNATTSIGLIYETTYKPADGLFHNKSNSFHNNAVVQHKPYDCNIDLADSGKITSATYIISGSGDDYVSYEDATIDNMFYRSLRANNSLKFVDGLGIGLFPKRSKDGSNIEANLEIAVHTEIKIKAEAFGGSVLSSGSATYAQSNPNRIYFLHSKKKFGNAYASDGLPTLDNRS